MRICDDCFQKLYPEEAAKKALAAEITATKSEAIEMNFSQATTENGSGLAQDPNEATSHTTPEQSDLQEILKTKVSANDKDVNGRPQDKRSDLPVSSDIKKMITDKPNEVLEGEACVILNTS